MGDPYATWNPDQATNESDGYPDVKMVPLVEALRTAGYTTYQSCQGHSMPEHGYVSRDGGLWIRQAPPYLYSFQPFTRVQHVLHGPEGSLIEFWWTVKECDNAIEEIRIAYGRRASDD